MSSSHRNIVHRTAERSARGPTSQVARTREIEAGGGVGLPSWGRGVCSLAGRRNCPAEKINLFGDISRNICLDIYLISFSDHGGQALKRSVRGGRSSIPGRGVNCVGRGLRNTKFVEVGDVCHLNGYNGSMNKDSKDFKTKSITPLPYQSFLLHQSSPC